MFISNRLLENNISTRANAQENDVKDYVSTAKTSNQIIKSHILTEQTTFNTEQQFVTKKYVDDNTGTTSMVDRPVTALAGQVSLIASDNTSSVHSVKTVKAGQGLQITTPEDGDCLQLGVGLDNTDSVILTDTSPNNPKHDVMIGYHAGASRNSFNQGKNVCIGGFAGRGGYGKLNVFIGYDAGRFITGHGNCYIGCKVPSNTSEYEMLRIGGFYRELITGKAHFSGHYIRFNTDNVQLDPNLKTEADYSNLVSGQIYVDTQNGHVLKIKP